MKWVCANCGTKKESSATPPGWWLASITPPPTWNYGVPYGIEAEAAYCSQGCLEEAADALWQSKL